MSEISLFTEHWSPKIFAKETPIVYSDQVPNMAYLLLDGEILLKAKRNKKKMKVRPNSLMGLYHLLKDQPFKGTAIIQPGSNVILIDKSTLFELMQTNREFEESLDTLLTGT